MRFFVAGLAILMLLAGCFGDAEPKTTGDDQSGSETTDGPGTDTSTATAGTGPGEATTDPEPDDPVDELPPLGQPFNLTATGCRELVLFIDVPIDDAWNFTPSSYVVMSPGEGEARAVASLRECDDVRLGNVSIGPASTSDSGVLVDKGGDSGVIHFYQAWMTSDHPALWERLEALGWYGGVSTDNLTGDLPDLSVAATVATANASYELTASEPSNPTSGADRAVGWRETPNGTMTTDRMVAGSHRGGLGHSAGFSGLTGDAEDLFGEGDVAFWVWNVIDYEASVDYA